MCGIAGYFSFNKNFEKHELEKITNSMLHRGPDAAGFFWNENQTCGLGHRRLSIIDLSSAANQPMLSHDSRFMMVFNGEIFNYREIAAELQQEHLQKFNTQISFKTHSDSEVILEAFSFWGYNFVNKLNGMFAIVIYDKKENSLSIFRDRLGVKPLYYFFENGLFVFGSELKAVVNFSNIKNRLEINPEAVNQFLHIGYIVEPISIYKQVKKFPAGAFGILQNENLAIKYYWKAEEKISENVVSDFSIAKNELKNLLLQSVKYRMISDVPFGTFLSGGVDSSLVTALAQQNSSSPVKTFSIGFKEATHNESIYAKRVSAHLKTNHHEFIVSEKDVFELIPKIAFAYDEPYADPSALPTMLVSKLARQHVTMTLSGDGGDELMHGYGMYAWAKRLNNPFLQMGKKPTAAILRSLSSRYKRIADLIDFEEKENLHGHIFSQEQYFFSRKELKNLVKKNWQSDFHFKYNFETKRKLNAAEEQSLFDIKYYLKDDLLTKVDRASMQFSLETRTPFLDFNVVEYCFNLDENLKVKNGIQKYLLKEILYDFVPKDFFNRPKWGFSIPLAVWLKNDLQYLLEEFLSEEKINAAGLVNYSEVKRIKDLFLSGSHNHYYNRLWNLIQLHNWYFNQP